MKYAAAVVLALALGLVGCGGSSGSGRADKVPEVVSGSPSSWPTITVTTPSASAAVPSDNRDSVAPLLGTRQLDRPAPLSEYGLDHPQATLTYAGADGAAAKVQIGQLNFDRHFVYVQREGRPAVYLVAADTLRPVLARAGIDLKPPE